MGDVRKVMTISKSQEKKEVKKLQKWVSIKNLNHHWNLHFDNCKSAVVPWTQPPIPLTKYYPCSPSVQITPSITQPIPLSKNPTSTSVRSNTPTRWGQVSTLTLTGKEDCNKICVSNSSLNSFVLSLFSLSNKWFKIMSLHSFRFVTVLKVIRKHDGC